MRFELTEKDVDSISPEAAKELLKLAIARTNTPVQETEPQSSDEENERPAKQRHWKKWTVKEEQQLKELNEQNKSIQQIAKTLGRTKKSIDHRIRVLGLEVKSEKNKHYKTWTKTDDRKLKELTENAKESDEEISKQLGRSVNSLRVRRSQLGIKKGTRIGSSNHGTTPYNEFIQERIKKHYKELNNSQEAFKKAVQEWNEWGKKKYEVETRKSELFSEINPAYKRLLQKKNERRVE